MALVPYSKPIVSMTYNGVKEDVELWMGDEFLGIYASKERALEVLNDSTLTLNYISPLMTLVI